MDDRTLLERAAKAAGIMIGYIDELGVVPEGTREDGPRRGTWNSLTDDGDALRLAVKLRMCVEPWGSGASAVVSINNRALVAEPHYGDDPERATRRAITRAAAALEGE